MPIYLRPGVFVKETDISQVVETISSSSAAIVMRSNRGPVDDRTLVTNARQFLDMFGNPDSSLGYGHYSALAFLREGNVLYVTRPQGDAYYSAVVVNVEGTSDDSDTAAANIASTDNYSFGSDDAFVVFAENPGAWGNNLKVRVGRTKPAEKTFEIEVLQTELGVDVLKEVFTVSRENIKDGNGASLEMERVINDNSNYIRVKNSDQQLTTLPSYLEELTLDDISLDSTRTLVFNVDDNNGNVRLGDNQIQPLSFKLVLTSMANISETVDGIDDVIAYDTGDGKLTGRFVSSGTINYVSGAVSITFLENDEDGSQFTLSSVQPVANFYKKLVIGLGQGTDATPGSVTSASYINAWKMYADTSQVDVRILINGGLTEKSVQDEMVKICESRKDCIAVLDSPSGSQSASNLISWKRNTQKIDSSYAALYAPDVEIYDEYNDETLYVPCSGYVAGVYARTDSLNDPWYAPAGYRRGDLAVRDVRFVYTEGEQDILYTENINYIRSYPGQPPTVWGQKTLQSEASKLDRVNVRRLLIVIERSIADALLYSVFEQNTDFTRLQLAEQVESFMRRIQSRNGVLTYRVECNELNNPPEVIDANELHIDVYIQPTTAAEFIQLQTVITRTGANFEELISTGGNF